MVLESGDILIYRADPNLIAIYEGFSAGFHRMRFLNTMSDPPKHSPLEYNTLHDIATTWRKQ